MGRIIFIDKKKIIELENENKKLKEEIEEYKKLLEKKQKEEAEYLYDREKDYE